MGLTSSTAAGAGMRVPDAASQALAALAGPEALPFDSAAWPAVLAQAVPVHQLDQELVYDAVRAVGGDLVKNVGASRNLTTLLAHIVHRLPRVAFLVPEDVANTASALCIARHCCTWLLRSMPAPQFAAQLGTGINPGVQPNADLDDLTLEGIVAGVLDFIADVPPSASTHDVVVEALGLLLALLATELACEQPASLPTAPPPQPVPPASVLPAGFTAAAAPAAVTPVTAHPAWDAVFRAAWDTAVSPAAHKAAALQGDPAGAAVAGGGGGTMRAARLVRRLLGIVAAPPPAVPGSAAVEATSLAVKALREQRGGAAGAAGAAAPPARDILDTLGELAATVVLSPFQLLAGIWAGAGTGEAVLASPLLHRATALLLLLVHSHRSAGAVPNPFRHFLVTAVDSHTPREESEGGEGSGHNPLAPRAASIAALYQGALARAPPLQMRFAALIPALARAELQPMAPALLYSLVQDNADFKAHLMASGELTDVVVAHLQQVYHAAAFAPPHRYVALIVTLILSQDAEVSTTLHRQLRVPAVPWVRERRLGDISLGSLAMLVLLRTLHVNLVEWKDGYVSTNCTAALANFSRTLAGAHPALAQRLVNVILLVARLLQRSAAAYAAAGEEGVGSDAAVRGALHGAVGTYSSMLQQLLEVLASALRPEAVASNLHVLYALLYKRELLLGVGEQLSAAPPAAADGAAPLSWAGAEAVLAGVLPLVAHCAERVAAAQSVAEAAGDGSLGEPGTVAALTSALQGWQTQQARAGAGAGAAAGRMYTYDELPTPEEFFVPYLWGLLLLLSPDLCWDSSAVRLVPVPPEVDVYRAPPPPPQQ